MSCEVLEKIENALDIVEECEQETSVKIVGDILENLANKFQEMNISEDKSLTKFTCEKQGVLPLKGTGDQLKGDDEVVEDDRRHPRVEKKNRLTDLVKNSKHVLAKLILNEHKESTESMKNEKVEKVLRVVDLDIGEPSFKSRKKIHPENIPLPRSDSREILQSPIPEETMDEIQLYGSPDDKCAGKGDICQKTMTFPLASGSAKSLTLAERCRTLKFPMELKKKKWNIGSKIVNYIRKHKKGDVSNGSVEIQPKNDSD
ncbi:hypothetical protein NQ315_005329 [Exocentrus adspersus]|uniref:Uncharacterized protein n=1 Tax=Exocentrus adspersus TaxID=1586481 RepID=A0AAV8W1J0_9CUCU|nr:hypothetical protein NQ315_005329 [Exocentrus adspersus]